MNTSQGAYADFIKRLTHLISKNPHLITVTLSNIFTMRLIGNKAHGDLAEIGICEFVNQYMYDFRSIHVGKDLYRAKSREALDAYYKNNAEILRQEAIKHFGDQVLSFRTELEIIDEYKVNGIDN